MVEFPLTMTLGVPVTVQILTEVTVLATLDGSDFVGNELNKTVVKGSDKKLIFVDETSELLGPDEYFKAAVVFSGVKDE